MTARKLEAEINILPDNWSSKLKRLSPFGKALVSSFPRCDLKRGATRKCARPNLQDSVGNMSLGGIHDMFADGRLPGFGQDAVSEKFHMFLSPLPLTHAAQNTR